MARANGGRSGSTSERELREVNEALLVSSVQQHELTELAQRAEAALRLTEAELRLRVTELARFNRAAVGRELRIIELKKQINELDRRLGEPIPYPLDFEGAETSGAPPPTAASHYAALQVPEGDDAVPLGEILRTDELMSRPKRSPDYETENGALVTLVRTLADTPGDILQMLAQTILTTLQADSAGLSLLSGDDTFFYWPAIAGKWSLHVGGGTPRNFGPCGDVLDRDTPLLFHHPERRYTYFRLMTPSVEEALLVPFYIERRAVGTLWAVAHGEKRFDAEDLRKLQSLGRFAAAAYRATGVRGLEESRRTAALNLMEDAVQSREAMQEANLELRALDAKTQELVASLGELNRRKDEFLAMLSHELRNPLASIRSATHVLRLQRDRSPIQVAAQGMIERQVSQLVRLLDDLLEVSRIATGRIRLQRERVDLREIVRRAVEAIRSQADQKRQSLTEPLSGEPVWVHGDAIRLEQVLVNLLNNASKYTDHGGSVRLTLQEESDEAVLRVFDTGVGIAPEMLPHVFDLFVQADVSLDRAQGGLGIGLALVRSIIDLHDGHVEAHSTLGQGSEFVVRLPLLSASEAPIAVPAENVSTPVHVLKLLVVDDNIDVAAGLGQLLQMSGHSVRLAHDGASALNLAREFAPDVVLLDIGLPVVDGYEVARRIRNDAAFDGMVLIALTGYGTESDRKRTREAGFDHHLVKPVDFSSLESVLSAAAARCSTSSKID